MYKNTKFLLSLGFPFFLGGGGVFGCSFPVFYFLGWLWAFGKFWGVLNFWVCWVLGFIVFLVSRG
jgi:hypothetical protein